MEISVVIPIFNPNKKLLERVISSIKEQEFPGKINIIKVDKGLGLAGSMNYGLKRAKTKFAVTVHQDCILEDKRWLAKLIAPFKDKNVVASVSDVHLPLELWKNFDIFAKSLTLTELGTITPLMDEKGCAYRKEVLEEIGFFNETDFRTAGEDFDMYLKLRAKGKIAYPKCKLIHVHSSSFRKRLKKNYQNANGFGALVKIHKKKMYHWQWGFLRATPLLGLPIFLASFPFEKIKYLYLFPFYALVSPIFHFSYMQGFWKGFKAGKQTI